MIFEFLPSNEMSTAEVHQMSTVEVHQLMMLNLEAQALSEMSTPGHHQLTLSIVEVYSAYIARLAREPISSQCESFYITHHSSFNVYCP